MFNGAAVLSVYHQTGELFPTPLRATAYGITGVTGMAATIAVPKLMSLVGYMFSLLLSIFKIIK